MVAKKAYGKGEEEFVRGAFVRMQAVEKFAYNRLYDTTSAGGSNIIPPQISDYLATFQGTSLAIEVKSSIKHTSMGKTPKRNIRSTQIAKMRLHLRAGGEALFIYVSGGTQNFEIYKAEPVITWYLSEERRKKLPPPCATGTGEAELILKLKEVLQ